MSNSVTFPVELGGSGQTITDDSHPDTGLGQGGHLVRFIPALQGGVDMAASAKGSAETANAERVLADQAKNTAIDRASAALGSQSAAASSANSASSSSATAGNRAAEASSSRDAANAALLTLSSVLANGVGAFSVNADGDLIASWNSPTVTNIAIDANGDLIVTYP